MVAAICTICFCLAFVIIEAVAASRPTTETYYYGDRRPSTTDKRVGLFVLMKLLHSQSTLFALEFIHVKYAGCPGMSSRRLQGTKATFQLHVGCRECPPFTFRSSQYSFTAGVNSK